MFELYLQDLFSVLTMGLVLGMMVFMVLTISNRKKIQRWGRRTALFVLAGIAISAFSAIRDSFAAPNALFGMTSVQALVCSAAGGLIIIIALTSIFFKKQTIKKGMLFVLFSLFVLQVLTIEISRPFILL